jgi:membrane protease subunit HflC
VAVIVLVVRSCFFMVDVTQFAVVTRLGKVRHVFLDGERGLHAKLPAPLEDVMPLDARVQVLDLPQTEYLTNDKTNVTIET